jgi:hypothetical protein
MTSIPPNNMQSNFEDPRGCADFLPQFYPTANAKDAPPADSPGQNERIVLEFLAAYYHLNCQYSRLLEVRKEPASPERKEAERKCLQDVEKVLIVRDALEDRYAPLGIIADPAVQDGFTADLKISFGNVDAAGRRREDHYTLTAYVPIPMPAGMKLEQLPLTIEGPGFNGQY